MSCIHELKKDNKLIIYFLIKDWDSPETVRIASLIVLPKGSISRFDALSFEKTQCLFIFPPKIKVLQ